MGKIETSKNFIPHSPERIARILEVESELTKIAFKFKAVKAGYLLDKCLVTFLVQLPNDHEPFSLSRIKNAVFDLDDRTPDFNFEVNISFVYQNSSLIDYSELLDLKSK